jgi:DNA-directed RNA polymerase specialized sigma24 family protein
MERLRDLRLLDENGHPLNARIESALTRLVPRFRKHFPMLQDEHDLTEVLERAGRRIANRERQIGAIESLHGYAWVTLRNVATSCVRRGSGKLAQHTLNSHESETALAELPAETGTPEQIELAILISEVETHLSAQERLVLGWKKAGFSSEEIAQFRGTSIGAVDALFSRAKHKIRTLLRVQQNGGSARKRLGHADRNVSRESSRDEANVERRDDHTTPGTGSLRLQVRR